MNNLGPHAGECSEARSLIYVLIRKLYSYYVYANNVGSVKSAHMHACPSIARRCGKYILLIKSRIGRPVLQPICKGATLHETVGVWRKTLSSYDVMLSSL